MAGQHRLSIALTTIGMSKALEPDIDLTVRTMTIKFATKFLLLKAVMNGRFISQACRVKFRTILRSKSHKKNKLRLLKARM